MVARSAHSRSSPAPSARRTRLRGFDRSAQPSKRACHAQCNLVTRLLTTVAPYKVCGCRPMMVARRTPGGGRTQTSKGGNRGKSGAFRASDAMGISASEVYCRSALKACFGEQLRGRRSCSADRDRQNRCRAAEIERPDGPGSGVRANMVIASREPAKHKGSLAILPCADLDHDVSILIAALDTAGR